MLSDGADFEESSMLFGHLLDTSPEIVAGQGEPEPPGADQVAR